MPVELMSCLHLATEWPNQFIQLLGRMQSWLSHYIFAVFGGSWIIKHRLRRNRWFFQKNFNLIILFHTYLRHSQGSLIVLIRENLKYSGLFLRLNNSKLTNAKLLLARTWSVHTCWASSTVYGMWWELSLGRASSIIHSVLYSLKYRIPYFGLGRVLYWIQSFNLWHNTLSNKINALSNLLTRAYHLF